MTILVESADPVDLLTRYRYDTAFPLGKWLINRRRRREGKAPFTSDTPI